MEKPGIAEREILIVDDDQLTAFALMSALKADDRNVLAVSSGFQALAEMESGRYDLFFLEIGLVDRSGKAVLDKINRFASYACTIVMSADIIDGETESAIIDHDHLFLPKPFEVLQVRTMVKRILSEQGFSRERTPRKAEGEEERRRWPRSAHSGLVECFPDRAPYSGILPETFSAEVADVSQGGVGLQTDHAVPPGQRIRFRGDTAVWEGVVRWSLVFGNRFRAGVKFV